MVDKSDARLWGLMSILGALVVLGLFINNGLAITEMNVLLISGVSLMISFILGLGVGDWFYDDVTKKMVILSLVSLFIGASIVGLILPYTSTAFGDVAGFGAQTEEDVTEPAFPSYMRGSVVNALSSPQTAISDATINFYDTEPTVGVGKVALYDDNTNSSGSFMTEVEESEGTLLWATASKSGYYSEKDSGTTGESGSGATKLTFGNYGDGLTEVGTFNKRITNAEPSDNITIDGSGDIVLDNAADTTFDFDLVIETSASETALRDLYIEMEEGSDLDNEAVEMEIKQVEDPDYGTLSASVVGGKLVWTDDVTETQIQCDGDLQYRKDLVISFTIDSDDATTGTIISVEEIDDLSSDEGLEGESGISAQSFAIKNDG